MNYRRNEDKLCNTLKPGYNLVHSVDDISDESGSITEPVTLIEMKNYLRLEGFGGSDSGVLPEDPLNLTLVEAATTVQSSLLIGNTILSLTRDGIGYAQGSVVANLIFTFNSTTGVISFNNAGSAGGEPVVVLYGNPSSDPDSVFDFDDELIEEMIISARQRLEIYTGVHFIPKTLKVWFTNGCGMIDLPGPVTGTISIVDSLAVGIEDSSITLIGSMFPSLKEPEGEYMVATYSAGYVTLPKGLKLAIMMQVAFDYENRGEEQEVHVCKKAAQQAYGYKKNSAYG